jgi:1-acyl-sn-glycerol-3-phosphate acyltransferase
VVATGSRPSNHETGTPATAPEGLDWLGHAPSARSNPLFTTLWLAGQLILRLSGLRVRVEGLQDRPASGGYILAIAGHRRWVDGPLVYLLSPREPRIWYLGNGVAIFRRPWLQWLMRAMGGVLPVYRGGVDVEVHLDAARAVLDGGGIFGIFPEGTRQEPELELGRFRRGIGFIALRTGAPILPVVLAGTASLYRGRRITYRILPPVTALELAELPAAPAEDSTAERDAVRLVVDRLQARLAGPYAELAGSSIDPPDHAMRWAWMTTLFD